jgi:peptide/nickel transport system permease protein
MAAVKDTGRSTGPMTASTAREIDAPPIRPSRSRGSVRSQAGFGQATAGFILLGLIAILGLLAPLLAPADPGTVGLLQRLKPPVGLDGALAANPLGTDHLGRDLLSRLLYGARVSLIVGVVAVVGSGLIGVALGLVAGYYRGLLDDAIMRLADIQQSFPYLALAIAVVAVVGPGLQNLILVLAVTGWVLYARVVRAEVLSIREKEFIEAARAAGASDNRILMRHILPNVTSAIIIIATFNLAYFIIAEASVTFLGLGVDPATPSWGMMLSESRNYLQVAWWYPTFPGLALLLTVLAANLLGDGLRDLWDPRMRSNRSARG